VNERLSVPAFALDSGGPMDARFHDNSVRLVGGLVAMFASGCSSTRPMSPEEMTEPALVQIHAALVDAVEWAGTNDEIDWTSGWTGNAIANATDDTTLGLCFEWQELVWEFARPVTERVGWRADGIAINYDTWSAHHAVVVWDPKRVDRTALLDQPLGAPVYVLDAWRRGEPDIHPLAAWIDIPIFVMSPPMLEDLTLEYGTAPRFALPRPRPVPTDSQSPPTSR
jgi:hypothetical protein